MIKVGSDFSGVGAFNQALMRLGIKYKEIFACDMDKFARETFIHNYGEPEYYPKDVYEREIPSESLDIYMTSPPCQAFSLAGKRLGKDDKRGILFFNSHEFIKVNKPRYFIFENVKGLLSDDGGKTFSEWCNMLGGKSVNCVPVLFPYEDSVPYHLYWKVLNAKEHGVPQNRERVFLIGIRDDEDNSFRFPVEEHLTKRLKDVLEEDVDDKYFLSEKMLESLTFGKKENGEIANLNKGGERGSVYDSNTKSMTCLTATDYKQPKQILINSATSKLNKVGFINQDTQASAVYDSNGLSQTMTAGTHGYAMGYIKINSATSKGYEEAPEVIQLNTSQESQGVQPYQQNRVYDINGLSPALLSNLGGDRNHNIYNYKIRRLTPRECFRLMDFPDSFTWPVSDSQAYKQAGNSIVVNVLYKIINNLNL
jgi:DNA (cytosine-5)-methyltransferase 1